METNNDNGQDTFHLTVTFRGTAHPLSVLPGSTLEALQTQLEELTSVPPSLQKLLFKGKKLNTSSACTLAEAGVKDGTKIQLLGSTEAELGGMRQVEREKQRRDHIMRQRAGKSLPKVVQTRSCSFKNFIK